MGTLARQFNDEVQERSNLRRHELCGVVVRIERVGLVDPRRQKPERGARWPPARACTGRAPARSLVPRDTPRGARQPRSPSTRRRVHGHNLLAADKLPVEGPAGGVVSHQDALVLSMSLGRVGIPCRATYSGDAHVTTGVRHQQPNFSTERLREAKPDADVEAVPDQNHPSARGPRSPQRDRDAAPGTAPGEVSATNCPMPASTFTRSRPRTLVEEPPASIVASSMAVRCGAIDS